MPTSNSFGTMPPALERRISDSTPGAILQPQPPPCEKLVRRSAVPGDAGAVVSILAVMASSLEIDGRIVSAARRRRLQQVRNQGANGAALGSRPKERFAIRALRRQMRGKGGVTDEAAHQAGERSGIASV